MLLMIVFGVLGAQAQNYTLKLKLEDKSNGEPVGYATVALTPDGKTEVLKYTQSNDQGKAEIKGIPAGKYKVSAILMGKGKVFDVVCCKSGKNDYIGEIPLYVSPLAGLLL